MAIILKQNCDFSVAVSQWYLSEYQYSSCWKLLAMKDKINEFKKFNSEKAKERNEHSVFNESNTQQHNSVQNSCSDCEPHLSNNWYLLTFQD